METEAAACADAACEEARGGGVRAAWRKVTQPFRTPDLPEVSRSQLVSLRKHVLVLSVVDLLCTIVLMMQLAADGFPADVHEFAATWDTATLFSNPAATAPLIVYLCTFPVAGALGAATTLQAPLWAYCPGLLAMCGARTALVFDAGWQEGLEPRDYILARMLLLTSGVIVSVAALRATTELALIIARGRMHEGIARRQLAAEPSTIRFSGTAQI